MLPREIHETLTNALNGLMCAEDGTAPIIASVHNNRTRSRKLFRPYPEVVNYYLKKNATDQAIAKREAAVLRYMQPSIMTLQQYADDLVAKSCRVADVYHEGTLNNIHI